MDDQAFRALTRLLARLALAAIVALALAGASA
jgi:hypothetical protein